MNDEQPTVASLLDKYGFVVGEDTDGKAVNVLTLLLLLYHFRGGEIYMLVFDEDKATPAYKVPILGFDELYAEKEGRTYSIQFEAGDGFSEAVKAVEATNAYKKLAGDLQ